MVFKATIKLFIGNDLRAVSATIANMHIMQAKYYFVFIKVNPPIDWFIVQATYIAMFSENSRADLCIIYLFKYLITSLLWFIVIYLRKR